MESIRRGLYAIADTSLLAEEALVANVTLALAGGVRVVQYRDKGNDHTKREREAQALQALCRCCNVPLLINDDVELALRVGAAGVHLGQGDVPLHQARARLGPSAIIGVSCYNDLSLALSAERAGASYVAFGRFFPSQTKPNALQAKPSLLTEAKRCLSIPLVAIGGITPENAPPLVAAGADLLAVIHALFVTPDVRGTAERFRRVVEGASLGG